MPGDKGEPTSDADLMYRDRIFLEGKVSKGSFFLARVDAQTMLSAPSPGDGLRSKSAMRLRGQNCMQQFFNGSL